jgi:hypothetical protein
MPKRVRVMMDAMTRADLYSKESTKYFNLAKSASSPFLRDYYRRIAERYLSSDDELRPPETAVAVGSVRDTKQSEAGVEFRLGKR